MFFSITIPEEASAPTPPCTPPTSPTPTVSVSTVPLAYVDLFVLLDESGSMDPRRNSVVGGFNEFIQKQRRLNPHGCHVSLFTFNEEVREVYFRRPLDQVPQLTVDDYRPDCMTALRDAMGHVLERIEQEREETSTVLLIVMTDGEENASTTISPLQLKRKLEDFRGEVTYMGSNQDAILNGRGFGAAAEASLNYRDENLLDAMDSLGNAIGRVRRGESQTIRYTRRERERSSGGTATGTFSGLDGRMRFGRSGSSSCDSDSDSGSQETQVLREEEDVASLSPQSSL